MNVRTEPGAIHRRVQALGIARILCDVVHFRAAKVRPIDVPLFRYVDRNTNAPFLGSDRQTDTEFAFHNEG